MALDYVYVGDHAQVLTNGRSLAHGDHVSEGELDDADQYLVNDERLIEPPPNPEPEPAAVEAESKRGRSSRAA